jgi:hypothetical protein
MDLDERCDVLIRALFWHIPGETEENHEKTVRIASVKIEIRTEHFLN